MSNSLLKQTEFEYTKVIYCLRITDKEYKLLLECGHSITGFTLRSNVIPKKAICKECYYKSHDKYGNRI